MPARPGRIDEIVVKLAERCNLDCAYCYMYHGPDQSWRDRPRVISEAIYGAMLARIAEYCAARPGHKVSVTFHGGEPTMVGARRLRSFAKMTRARLGDSLRGLSMQTNGTLITDAIADVVREQQIQVGVSLDGPADINDALRVDRRGRGSYAAAVTGLRRLQALGLTPGLLCVIQPGQDGLRVYRGLRALDPPGIDFLLPDVTHDSKAATYPGLGATPVADYLIPIFDAWFAEDNPSLQVRLFWGLLRLMLGGPGTSDVFGNPRLGYLVIDTDGAIQSLDVLKVCDVGISESGLNVTTHGFDDLETGAPQVHEAIHSGYPPAAPCRACPELAVCGGGFLPQRYSRARRFDNPSVWCADILALLAHIRARTGISPELTRQSVGTAQGRLPH